MIRSILKRNPAERPTIAELCKHPWILIGDDFPEAHQEECVVRREQSGVAFIRYASILLWFSDQMFTVESAYWRRHFSDVGIVYVSSEWH